MKWRSIMIRRTAKFRISIIILILFVLFCVIHFNYHRVDDRTTNLKFYIENLKTLSNINESECVLPQYDIYDPQIKRYIEYPPIEIDCEQPQPYLTYMDWNGMLYLNQTEIDSNKYTDLNCIYEVVTRDKVNDYKVLYEDTRIIKSFPILITKPVIKVSCKNLDINIYNMIHSQILPMSRELTQKNRAIPKHMPSVLILTIDSMSRGNFLRSLPKTYDYLMNHEMDVFKGLNKVADNTFPNMVALLSGFIGYPRDDMPHMPRWSLKYNSTVHRYDDMPILWKDFKKANYVTMYAEEYLDAIFSYLDVGFLDDPVDCYYRSTYVSLKDTLANINYNKFKFWNKSKWRYCLGNVPSYKYMLNYTEEFLVEMATYRYFALSFFVEMSHEYLNDVKNMDDDLLIFFKKMFETGAFNNTVVVVMGDHGHRFDAIRSTFIGRIEERMPFLGIVLPNNLKLTHPHLKTGLASHTNHLLSWYDIHETLLDIALDDLEIKPKYSRPNNVGKSIFRFFNETRSCKEIGILPEYCMCDREAQIPANSSKALETAEIIVKNINLQLEDASRYIRKGDDRACAYLSLTLILSASMSMKTFSFGTPTLIVRTVIKVYPSDALLEAAVQYRPMMKPEVYGDVNRINKYGNQSSCISHDTLRLYCYCS